MEQLFVKTTADGEQMGASLKHATAEIESGVSLHYVVAFAAGLLEFLGRDQ